MADNGEAAKKHIKHIVVLMMENRSFDHMLGHLSLPPDEGGLGRKDIEGIDDPDNHVNPNRESGKDVSLHRLRDTRRVKIDMPHSAEEVEWQINPTGSSNDMCQGFVNQYISKVREAGEDAQEADLAMSYYAFPEVWALTGLAKQSTVCDHWFSSLPGPTQPNRMTALAGTSNHENKNIFPPKLWNVTTLFEYLDQAKVEWRAYSHDVSSLRYIYSHVISPHIEKISIFYDRAQRGNLPHVTWIDPNFRAVYEEVEDSQKLFQWAEDTYDEIVGNRSDHRVDLETDNSDHPDADIARGQELIARVYNALLENDPKLEETLFILAYDEHGGFYDHVIPPGWESADPALSEQLGYSGGSHKFGVRVPIIVASGWLESGSVCQHALDHAAITKTVLNRFSLGEDSPERPDHLARVPDLWTALEGSWREKPQDEPFQRLRKPKPGKTALREEMGDLIRRALEGGTPVERL
ncbi:alkaline phosphatase family protein [Fodinicurvata halophila]|uniref:Alkaline phosphatase family protein n=1 Tax=Fodinicurvata halophila TaxID=1419723 RepID=A0ABV8UHR2_9PROT